MAQEMAQATDRSLVPEELLDITAQDAGRGVSFDQDDQLIPLIYVLQSNSPVVDKRGDNYIQGAEPGHFWLRNALEPIVSGVDGLDCIPCGMQHTWIEWLPARAGFVQRHDKPPADMEVKITRGDDGRERKTNVRHNGNIIQETREFFILVGIQPYVFPCSGTKHNFARRWQSMYHQFRHPKTGGVMPSFSRKYKLTTVNMKNALGTWLGVDFQDLGPVTLEEYKMARALNDAIGKGAKKAEAPIAAHSEPPGGGDDDIPF
jgi:hypothetical protein